MTEIYEPGPITEKVLLAISERVEKALQIRTGLLRYMTVEQRTKADEEVKVHSQKIREKLEEGGLPEKDIERILMGIYHYPDLQEPPEFEYKLARNRGYSDS